MNITVRTATVRDITRIINLLEQTAQIHNSIRPDIFKSNTKKYSENDLLDLLEDKKVIIFIAADENDLALGYIFCVINEYKNHVLIQDKKTLYIDDLCVDEAKRGLNIGKTLYSHVCKYAKEIGCYNITLNVWAGNEKAIHFYEKLGLKEQKRILEMIL